MRPTIRFLLGCAMAAAVTTAASALTLRIPVTPASLREQPGQFKMKVTAGKNGLLDFTLTMNVKDPAYLVAHLSVHHAGHVMAESHTPCFTRNAENTFYFSLAPEDVAESTFELGQSSVVESGGQVIPIVGTMEYQFQLWDFVPESLRSAK